MSARASSTRTRWPQIATELGLGQHILLGKGESAAGGAGEAVDPRRRARGGDRCGLRRRRAGRGLRRRRAADRRAPGFHRGPTRPARLQVDAPGARGRCRQVGPDLRPHGRGSGPRQAVLRQGDRRRHGARHRSRPVEAHCRAGRGGGRGPGAHGAEADARSAAPRRADGIRMPELPEVETVRRGLERLVVGRRDRPRRRRQGAHRAADVPPGGHRRPDGRDDDGSGASRQVPAESARHRRHGDGPPADERAAAARRPGSGTPAAHARGDVARTRPGARHRRPGAVVRRSPHVR